MNTTRAVTLTVLALVIGAQQGFAADGPTIAGDFRTRANGFWSDSSTWEEWSGTAWVDTADYPRSNSLATIRAGHLVRIPTLNSARIRTLIMKEDATSPATLQMFPATSLKIYYALEMENDGSGAAPKIMLVGGAASLIAKSDITIAGTVDAIGNGVNSITSDTAGDVVTVSSSGLLAASSGDLTVTSADVVMDGTVNPGTDRTITFSGGINSGSSGNWELTNSGSVIKIATTSDVDIVSSAGHILITDGTLDIDQGFTFAGGLKQTGGTIDVASGETFFKVTGRYFD